MKGKKYPVLGVIAEDFSDVDTIKQLVFKITGNSTLTIKRKADKGCGKIINKGNVWSKDLKNRGCSLLVVVHDLDNNNLEELKEKIRKAIEPSPIKNFLICIPIKEIEAWLLCDEDAISKTFSLKKKLNIPFKTDNIKNPKEFLIDLVKKNSNSMFVETKHNAKIAQLISINKIKERNSSFLPFYEFIKTNYKP